MFEANTIFNFTMIAGVFLGFVFLGFTSLSKSGKDKSVFYLNLVVLFLTLNYLQIVLIDTVFTDVNYFVRSSLIPFYLLIVPSFYYFLIYYLKVERKVFSFFRVAIYIFISEITISLILIANYYHREENYVVAQFSQFIEIINALFSLFIFIKASLLIFNNSKLINYVLKFDNILWLKKFLFFGSLVLLFWIVAIILNLGQVLNPKIFIYYPLRISSSVLLYWIGYQAFFHYELLSDRIEIRDVIANNPSLLSEGKIYKSSIKTNEKFEMVRLHVENTNCYLDPDLTLPKLASALEISFRALFLIINKENGTSFPDYSNQFRVEKAKEFLKDATFNNYTIESIGLECGFNSKSTFYTAFKKFSTLTPTIFRSIENQ